jgi:hypothetical protein
VGGVVHADEFDDESCHSYVGIRCGHVPSSRGKRAPSRLRPAPSGHPTVQRPEPVALSPGEIATLIASLSALGPYTTATGDSALRKLVAALTSGSAKASMGSDAETRSLPDGQDEAGRAE